MITKFKDFVASIVAIILTVGIVLLLVIVGIPLIVIIVRILIYLDTEVRVSTFRYIAWCLVTFGGVH